MNSLHRPEGRSVLLRAALAVGLTAGLSTATTPGRAHAQPVLFVSSSVTNPAVGKYDATTGATINAAFVSGSANDGPFGLALDSSNHLFVGFSVSQTVGEYDATTGAVISPAFLPAGTAGRGMVVSGNRLIAGGAAGKVATYDATTGATVNANFVTLPTPPGGLVPYNSFGMALDAHNHLFIVYGEGFIGEYDATTGAIINQTFITAPGNSTANARTIAIDAGLNHLLVSEPGNNAIGLYDATTGATINANFISGAGLNSPWGITLDGNNHLFVANQSNSTIGEYDAATGATINAAFVNGQGLDTPYFLVFAAPVPEPSSLLLLAATAGIGAAIRRSRTGQRPAAIRPGQP